MSQQASRGIALFSCMQRSACSAPSTPSGCTPAGMASA
eukprot:CAMPEP_0168500256 /NCGR_PEP_ID=MMETSP0228-20121227/74195_1 /TAXON_ID=133427 /ORGANISM="Protoceratium reticulatum, Strain CCCM 535 (=CCMP 1889)" /LENGTH=37 /DNA_ID= /DNA_START= /DNA_END= /DNA_ORIENTATION=